MLKCNCRWCADVVDAGQPAVRADTRQRDATASAALLDALTPFFDQGTFQAPIIDRVISLADGRTAYEQVARGEARGRLVLVP
jgi:NADPH:quinone reductase-like Zn-dependent oxidoreductase